MSSENVSTPNQPEGDENFPTFLNPWYVVMQPVARLYATGDSPKWTLNPHEAGLFTNLQIAARIAGEEDVILVIYNRDVLKKYQRKRQI